MVVKKPTVFLCYARNDELQTERLYEKLVENGLEPWMDTKNILPGQVWKDVIMNAIRSSTFFLACLSKNSVNKRGIVQEEIREALEIWRQKLDSDIYFIPVRFEECEVPMALTKFQWVDMFSNNGFLRLLQALRIGIQRLDSTLEMKLREQPKELSEDDVKSMISSNDFYDSLWNWMGRGVNHKYEKIKAKDNNLIVDHVTNLVWQGDGSETYQLFNDTTTYINGLNKRGYGGFNNWRLPTLEEAMSLIEPAQTDNNLKISNLFSDTQKWIWTADKHDEQSMWLVDFARGLCFFGHVDSPRFIRAAATYNNN